MADEKTVDQLVDEVKSLVEKKHDEVKAIATAALGKTEAGEKLTEAAKQLADEALTGLNEAKARLDELEQKVARKREEEVEAIKSLGEQVTGDPKVKEFLANPMNNSRVGVELKAIISASTADAAGSAGAAVVPQYLPGIVPVALQKLTVRDLITPGRTTSNSIIYVQETAFTNAAATVDETTGPTKPQSDLQLNTKTSNVTTIAHWVQATRQILDDVPQLQSYIDGRLTYGLKLVEDNQLLNGAGTGTDLDGIYTQATASTANLAVVDSPTKIDVLRAAMLQAALANIPPSGMVLHPTDWFGIETTKTSYGEYIIGSPQDGTTPRLWGLPVVETPAMTSGKFLVGAFKYGAQIFDRMDSRVEISTEDSTNFRQNLVTILCEERLALAVFNTLAFVKGDFAAQITDLTS